ncbi:MAG TPA: hypothetical protein VKS81_05255 [Bacteroidota bacterium]|nr:hypothetical protein [Bacteroidota bacterium]
MKAFLLSISIFFLFSTGYLSAQVTWTKYTSNPVIPATSNKANAPLSFNYTYLNATLWDSTHNLYRMWFENIVSSHWQVSSAISPNGIDWYIDERGPILSVGATGSFDASMISPASVVYDGATYRLYYTGYDGVSTNIGLATSTDGINWTKYSGNPIISHVPGTWKNDGAGSPQVSFDGSKYTMVYGGAINLNGGKVLGNLGEAESPDGYTWTDSPLNPLFPKSARLAWDTTCVIPMAMCKVNGTYFMLINAGPYSPIGLITSTDAINWTENSTNPIFSTGLAGSWDNQRVEYGSMQFRNNQFLYFYPGIGSNNQWQIGLATSPATLLPPGTLRIQGKRDN